MSATALTPTDLRAFRKAVGGWSQAKLADELQLSRRTVEDWERGINPVPAWVGLALAALNHNLEPWRPPEG